MWTIRDVPVENSALTKYPWAHDLINVKTERLFVNRPEHLLYAATSKEYNL